MNLKINYFDNNIKIENDYIQVIEIENKKTFYRLVSDLYKIKNDEKLDEVFFYDNNNQEINMYNKVDLYVNFFDIDLNSKKNLNALNKNIINSLTDNVKEEILNNFKKLSRSFTKILSDIDLPLSLNDNITVDDIIKLLKISINKTDDLLNNLLLLIDLEKVLKINAVLFFINLKQYLSQEELIEFYKYAIYNEIKIVLVDSQSYGIKLDYEKKLIIDANLDEFVL
mgnify:FL=1